jgi:hypothetical protein
VETITIILLKLFSIFLLAISRTKPNIESATNAKIKSYKLQFQPETKKFPKKGTSKTRATTPSIFL